MGSWPVANSLTRQPGVCRTRARLTAIVGRAGAVQSIPVFGRVAPQPAAAGNYTDWRSDSREGHTFDQWQAMLEGNARTGVVQQGLLFTQGALKGGIGREFGRT